MGWSLGQVEKHDYLFGAWQRCSSTILRYRIVHCLWYNNVLCEDYDKRAMLSIHGVFFKLFAVPTKYSHSLKIQGLIGCDNEKL
jgi:hypothetical protein